MWHVFVFFFKQKTAYEMRISDWSSDVCSSDLCDANRQLSGVGRASELCPIGYDDPDDSGRQRESEARKLDDLDRRHRDLAEGADPRPVAHRRLVRYQDQGCHPRHSGLDQARHLLCEPEPLARSEEHSSELQSLMRLSYAVFCLKKKKKKK